MRGILHPRYRPFQSHEERPMLPRPDGRRAERRSSPQPRTLCRLQPLCHRFESHAGRKMRQCPDGPTAARRSSPQAPAFACDAVKLMRRSAGLGDCLAEGGPPDSSPSRRTPTRVQKEEAPTAAEPETSTSGAKNGEGPQSGPTNAQAVRPERLRSRCRA